MPQAVKTLRARLFAKLAGNYLNTQDGLAAEDINALQHELKFRTENGVRQVEVMWRDVRTVTATTGTDYLVLSSLIADIFGTAIQLGTVNGLLLINRSTVDGDNLLVGGAGEADNAWSELFDGDPDAQLVVQANSPLMIGWKTGLAVTPGISEVLKVQYDGVSGQIEYAILLLGLGCYEFFEYLLDEDGVVLDEEPLEAGVDGLPLLEEPLYTCDGVIAEILLDEEGDQLWEEPEDEDSPTEPLLVD